ncbi:MAG: alkaline phosphatase family protein [Acidobacteria bacterium]|nr:alkaline phosphatase family protein [Acidobacteriota bacterium]
MTPQPPVDLRDRLRALGYLNAPVDRFVLGGVTDRRSAAMLAAGASARIGLLAGLLLGPAGAIGLASKLPELITNVTDALVMALYLAVMFGVAAAVASFAVIMPAGLLAQSLVASPTFPAKARRVAATAGTIIFLACLAYLTLWWRAAVTTSSAPTPAFSAAVLGVAVTISLVLGHVVMVTALAFVARIDPSEALRPGVPLSSWNVTLPMAALAFLGAGALLFAAAPGSAPAPAVPSLTVVPTGERVLVLAIDGVDPTLLNRLRAGASLPSFARLLSGGVATLASDDDRDPARVWTTIATGQPPSQHGISALEGRQLAGVEGRLRPTSRVGALVAGATDLIRLTRPAIASGTERRIPTFWEVAARAGLRTSVIQWWATWPASERSEDAGIVLSDRALLRLEQGGALDSEIAPAALYTTLESTWPSRRASASQRAQVALAADTPTDVRAIIERSAQLDATIAALAAESSIANVDLQVVYLPGLDIAQHGLFGADPAAAAPSPSAMAARVQAIERYYVFLDGLLGDLTRDQRTVITVTQPGRVAAPGTGLFAVSGAPARLSSAVTNTTTTAIAATTLYLLGVPTADDLAGHVATPLVAEAFLARHPARSVPTYGARRPGPRRTTGQPLDQEMIERMRSLGYVK